MEYEAVIGLEVHAQLLTESKIFCGCSTSFGAPPNTHVCPVCLGMPGVLPVLNQKVVEFTIRAGLATNCAVQPKSVWARKNYFYPDLPKDYQISQYELPICLDGWLDIEVEGETKRIGITRIHMEEDAGKLVHDPALPVSYVDYNRTGVPLMEIVSEPDMRSPEEAGAYLRTLRDVLVYLEICDGNMEEGSFRCDANVSIRPRGQQEFGTRAELKNMNSFRGVVKALEYEIRRQRAILDEGGSVVQETRLWDADQGKTFGMRGKEEAHDYRYFPDPDLIPVMLDEAWIERCEKELPELPEARRNRFIEEYDLPERDADLLTSERDLAEYFEEAAKQSGAPKKVGNWMMGDFLRELNHAHIRASEAAMQPAQLAELVSLVEEGVISGKIAKDIFPELFAEGGSPKSYVEEKGLVQISDSSALEAQVDEILAANPDEVEAYRGGKTKLLGFFVGQVMRATKGQANPGLVNQILKDKLGG
eukprot:TRINITY_DN4267_c1_g2_i3.p2 TRINITY_DN4267_c1_g2~~TRINITY_DN4267_c1_g2_i3.p2  ORF type:complete len:477 (+),score=198.91 TRINITY_DN4267_c1_g2_i3:248-1678(+)